MASVRMHPACLTVILLALGINAIGAVDLPNATSEDLSLEEEDSFSLELPGRWPSVTGALPAFDGDYSLLAIRICVDDGVEKSCPKESEDLIRNLMWGGKSNTDRIFRASSYGRIRIPQYLADIATVVVKRDWKKEGCGTKKYDYAFHRKLISDAYDVYGRDRVNTFKVKGVYMPNPPCRDLEYAGWGQFVLTRNHLQPLAHEIGHLFRLGHEFSDSRDDCMVERCSSGAYGPSPMGFGIASFPAHHRATWGLIPDSAQEVHHIQCDNTVRYVTLRALHLEPWHGAKGVSLLRIPRHASIGGSEYSISYRTARGYDAEVLPKTYRDRVHVYHLHPDNGESWHVSWFDETTVCNHKCHASSMGFRGKSTTGHFELNVVSRDADQVNLSVKCIGRIQPVPICKGKGPEWHLLHSGWIKSYENQVHPSIRALGQLKPSASMPINYNQVYLECGGSTRVGVRRVLHLASLQTKAQRPYPVRVKEVMYYSGDVDSKRPGNYDWRHTDSWAELHTFGPSSKRFIIRPGQIHCSMPAEKFKDESLGQFGRVWVRDSSCMPTQEALPTSIAQGTGTTTTTTTTTGPWVKIATKGWCNAGFLSQRHATSLHHCQRFCQSITGCTTASYMVRGGGFCMAYNSCDTKNMSGLSHPHGPLYDTWQLKTQTTITSTTSEATTTMTTAPSTSSTPVAMGIQSGDTIFLKTRSGQGKHIDVEGGAVQARWASQGNWQALVIEGKESVGNVNSGDTVYLKSIHTGAHIDVEDEVVQARFHDHGALQAMIIEKRTGDGGVILPGDSVCFRTHTGKHLDVEDAVVQARWDDCGDWQAMEIQKEVAGAVLSGASIYLLAHTGKHIHVEGDTVGAVWNDRGEWQKLTIESYGSRVIHSGAAVFLASAHTGTFIDVQGTAVRSRWNEQGDWQRLFIERKGGSGPVMPGDTIYLKAHTGNMIEVEGDAVQARWSEKGDWQALVIEVSDRSSLRRMAEDTADHSHLGALDSIVII